MYACQCEGCQMGQSSSVKGGGCILRCPLKEVSLCFDLT